MIIESVDKVFNINQGHQITEEEIYNSFGSIPIYTGNNEKVGFVENAIISEEELPCISYPTKGNVGNFYIQNELFNANNTAVLTLKDKWKGKIDLYWAISYLSSKVKEMCNSKSGVGYIGKNIMKEIILEIPDFNKQVQIGKLYKNMLVMQKSISEIKDKYSEEDKKTYIISEYEDKIKNIFNFFGGNNGLTKEFIYHNQPINHFDTLKIYSGSTLEENLLGYISKSSLLEKKESGPAILVTRKGYFAGTMSLVEDIEFVINDDAYVLKIKPEWEEYVNLKWFIYQYQDLFFNLVTSKSDNATFSKSYVEEQIVQIPSVKLQENIATILNKKEKLLQSIKEMNIKLSWLLECQII